MTAPLRTYMYNGKQCTESVYTRTMEARKEAKTKGKSVARAGAAHWIGRHRYIGPDGKSVLTGGTFVPETHVHKADRLAKREATNKKSREAMQKLRAAPEQAGGLDTNWCPTPASKYCKS